MREIGCLRCDKCKVVLPGYKYSTYIDSKGNETHYCSDCDPSSTTDKKDIYLFLDFDGVLNSVFSDKDLSLSPYHVNGLNMLCETLTGDDPYYKYSYNLNIVISSTYRKYNTIESLQKMLVEAGFEYPELVVDKTSVLGTIRGTEIKSWLEKNVKKDQYHIIILDDDSDMGELKEHLVQTHSHEGFSYKNLRECVYKITKDEFWR